MISITDVSDIVTLVQSRFTDWELLGHVYTKERGALVLFNYSPAAAFERKWNYFERVSRGLIINRDTGEIVARPFDKFFNWFEDGRHSTGYIVSVTEKLDGSLGILYRDDGYRIATRGSFDGDQALWATEFLKNYELDIPNELTLLFEIIYPENRIVVDYGDREDLVLIAARNRFTGEYLPLFPHLYALAQESGFSLPQIYSFNNVTEILEAAERIDANCEGWVVEFSDEQRFKFKGDQYREIHRLVTGLSFKKTLHAVRDGTVDQLLAIIPEEFRGEVNSWLDEITATITAAKSNAESLFMLAPKSSRKEFAQYATSTPVPQYLFALLDEKDITELIIKHEF